MSKGSKERVVVAMSGGVDSSVAASLLVEQGYEVIGISMRLWSYEKEATHGCCTPDDLYDARRVADRLGIPYYVANFQKSFENEVVDNFVQSYARGETPNPCVRCNQDVKFSVLLNRSRELGASKLATGHYARKERIGEQWVLKRALDTRRDQSYFLYGLGQGELSQLIFPLGDYRKEEVREHARRVGLPVADKDDSQEICFVPGNYVDFVEKKLPAKDRRSGRILNEKGEILGHHSGIHQFTVGQRKGIGIQSSEKTYVLQVLPQTGDVVVGDDDKLLKNTFEVREARWSCPDVPSPGHRIRAQIRSRFEPAEAVVEKCDSDRVRVRFSTPQRAITPGQAAVFYDHETVIGGGWIDRVIS